MSVRQCTFSLGLTYLLAGAVVTNDIRRHDYTLIITDPDGVNTTQTWDVVDDTTGVQAYAFTPDKVGNYTLTFNYAGQTYTWNQSNTPTLSAANALFYGDHFHPASVVRTLEVTEEQVPPVTNGAALPTEYWSRPINGQNSNWYTISSNWLNGPYIRSGATSTGGAGYGRYQQDGSAPETSHVMWTKPIQFGGVVGGDSTKTKAKDTTQAAHTTHDSQTLSSCKEHSTIKNHTVTQAAEETTLQLTYKPAKNYWRIDRTAIIQTGVPSFGYLYGFEDGNQHGVLPNGLLIAQSSVTGLGTVWRGIRCSNRQTHWN